MSGGTGYGITVQGFVLPQLTDLQTDLNQAMLSEFGANINLSPESFFGQISGIMAERFSLLWQALQDVYSSQVPDTAFGASLDNVGAIRGIPRNQATFSVDQNVRLFGTAGTLINPGTQFSVQGSPSNIFQTTAPVTLVAGQNCIQTLTFTAVPVGGQWKLAINGEATPFLAFNITAANLQVAVRNLNFCSGCVVTGDFTIGFTITFAGPGTGGLMVQPQFTIPANTLVDSGPNPVAVIPLITQPGLNQAAVNVTATVTGPIIANTGTLTVIVTPVSGLTNVLNTQDASIGSNVESDNAYRTRMNEELQIAGAGTVEAIRSRLLATAGVTSALVYENIYDITDMFGRPPHSFESYVSGGQDADIANTIWAAKPGGIRSFGTVSFTITDSQGLTHVIQFSRPTPVNVFLIVNLKINTITYPANGDDLVKEVLDSYINGLDQGVSIIVNPLLIAQLATIPGIDDSEILIGLTPGPTLSDNITILPFQQAATDTSSITVNTVPG